jgi:crotonobetainyl-CoA:carnitine CoA-transferase CaiB-like acyl-CoA transferase
VFADPQVAARGMKIDLPHPLSGTVPQVPTPLKLSATPLTYNRAPPLLGEHTARVLEERLDISAAECARLNAAGVIQCAGIA